MVTLHPYLNFNGNTEEAFNFYKSVFGGEFLALQRFGDIPDAGRVPAHELNKIMHIALSIGEGTLLMGTDALESMGHSVTMGNNFHLSLDTSSVEEATTLFNALAQGGKVEVPFEKAFWGAYFGMLTDQFNIKWMVNHDLKKEEQEQVLKKEAETTTL
ncbi:VOC family protein [Rufibacter hautae]|uniref:VOC family protein n=1 Tax=Rufibacter hautae TaxID=2595005 RepID=A0A5B6TNC9_9BACT|nr:VOC family protein [Rufibacter hautae]KAA3437873.1 VOC family protein [Rufibacter hautae]